MSDADCTVQWSQDLHFSPFECSICNYKNMELAKMHDPYEFIFWKILDTSMQSIGFGIYWVALWKPQRWKLCVDNVLVLELVQSFLQRCKSLHIKTSALDCALGGIGGFQGQTWTSCMQWGWLSAPYIGCSRAQLRVLCAMGGLSRSWLSKLWARHLHREVWCLSSAVILFWD